MTNTFTERTEMPKLLATLEVGPFAEFNARNLTTMMQTGTAAMNGASAYWRRLATFVGARMKADAEAACTLSSCRTGEDAAKAQHHFISKMMSDYFNEMHALLSISADIAKGMAEPVETRAEEALQAMETRAGVA